MKLLDRYVIRNFLQAFFYSSAAFFAIWLVFDISDNISVFLDKQFGFTGTAGYYLSQLPEVFVNLLPIALLLGLLFSLGRMSRTNEIVSMLTSGVSIPRMLLPLAAIGLLTTMVVIALNYSAAPHAELTRRIYMSRADPTRFNHIQGQIFRNRTDARTWFIQDFRIGGNVFNNVQILQQDAHDDIVANYLATRALYRPETKSWQLESPKS